MKKNSVKQENTNRGITLVALVVTIVVLLILAAITIMYIMGDNSIFKQASDAKLKTDIAQWQERLETAKAPNIIEGLGKFEPDKYFEDIEKQKIINDKETDVKDNEDGTYEVTTKPGYVFEVELIPTKDNPKDAEIEYIGKVDNLGPVIEKIAVTEKDSNSITVEVTVDRLENGKLSYYYKKENEETYHELEGEQNTSDLTAKITGLEQNKIYNIKVVVKNKKGTAEAEISEITGELRTGTISQKGETIWSNGKASIELETNPTGLTMEYQVNEIDGTWSRYEGAIGNLDHEDRVYARITDGTNAGDTATVEIRDGIEPTNATIDLGATSTVTGVNVTAKVTHNDAQSGVKIASCKWVYNTTAGKIGTTASSYTGGTFTTNGQTINLKATTSGTYYLHVLTTDNANNVWETVSNAITVKVPATSLELNSIRARIATGYTRWLTATVEPTNAGLEWTSSNTNVAIVDSEGKITAKTEGTTIITVTAKKRNGTNLSKTCAVTVANGVDITTLTSIQPSNKIARDSYGNLITVPGGFKVLTSEATNATQGIVIQDNEGNEFVWVPVDSVTKGTNVRADDIRLGRYRYSFEDNGAETLVQESTNYDSTDENTKIDTYFQELQTSSYGNITAKSLNTFLNKTNSNGGYYLARYEASYKDSTHCYSRKSTSTRASRGTALVSGMLWNYITQPEAATVARNSFNSSYVESDLINSYSWDTAIVFIQTYSGDSDYSIENGQTFGGSLANTGTSGDKRCNIYDMASNCEEWSTECSTRNSSIPCVYRGGNYYYSSYNFTALRSYDTVVVRDSRIYYSFRSLIYVK